MNENGREEALFMALLVPNDNVRLAVVKCLLQVPIEQLDEDE